MNIAGIALFAAQMLFPAAETKPVGYDGAKVCVEDGAAVVGFQNGPVDSAAIYDAKCGVGNYSPLFNPLTYKPHKAYWAFVAFNELRKLGTAVGVKVDGMDFPEKSPVYATAAKGADGLAVMIVNFGKNPQPLSLDLGGGEAATCRITDETRTWAACALPETLPPYSFVVVQTGK